MKQYLIFMPELTIPDKSFPGKPGFV